MVETIKNVIATLINTLMQVKALGIPKSVDEAIAFVKALVFDVIGSLDAIYILTIAICAAVVAFNGYKLFKMGLYVVAPVAFAYIARRYSGLILPHVDGFVPEYIDTLAVLMIIAGVVAVVLSRFARKFVVMLIGAAGGYIIGTRIVAGLVAAQFPTLTFLLHDISVKVFGVICAIIVGILFKLLFLHGFIIGTGIGGMAACGLLMGMAVMPTASKEILIGCIAVGALAGVFAVIHQYNEEEKANDIFYTYKI